MVQEAESPRSRSGNPKKLSVLLFSSDPIAIDSIACKMQANLGVYHYESIELVGENVESFIDENFEVTRTPPVPSGGGRLKTFVKNRISPRPAIDIIKCTICGTCVEMCPVDPKAVDWHKGDKSKSPTYKYGRCIRCYCCQESCPEGAIAVDNPLLGRIFFSLK
jgi:ferredoxin